MRKYFLLSAVAILSASNVYAENPAAAGIFNIESNVQIVDEINCSTILSLSILSKEEGGNVSVSVSPTGEISQILGSGIVYSMASPAVCSISNNTFVNVENFQAINNGVFRKEVVDGIASGDDQPATDFLVSDFTYLLSDDGKSVSIGGTFEFANITRAYYHASVTLMYTY